MNLKNITIAGSGVLGTQIAFQCAYHGYTVILYDISDEALKKATSKFNTLQDNFRKDLHASEDNLKKAIDNITYASNLALALENADLLIEAIPENPQIKSDFYKEAGKIAPEKTIFATNSSTLLPSQFAEATGRGEKFLALHFANDIWKRNTAEIMGHAGADINVFNTIVEFAKTIGMIALPIYKEQLGYILNSLLVPFLNAATTLLIKGVADIPTIDKTWMLATGAPLGPFAILDIVGIMTAFNINKIAAQATKDPLKIKTVEFLQENFIDKNKLGIATGEGFYKYPNPAYRDKDFLK